MLGVLAGAVALGQAAAPADWQRRLEWQGKAATMEAIPSGGYLLHLPNGERRINAQKLAAKTASPLFDGLFAMAQDDLRLDSVAAIKDDAFDHGQSIPCACFETGEKWHYVWTRDLSYAVDLALWRLDPARAKASLRFKLSEVREPSAPAGEYVMQDTGSGGSWPISTDRIVWFLAARHLLDDKVFADQVYGALTATLAQDRQYIFDTQLGLYRGETSFLDWREQSYPGWTAKDVTFIGQSFALSTNVLHYQALQLAAQMAEQRDAGKAADYAAQAQALKAAINARFWRADRGQYMSYIGGADHPVPYEAYDLLGLSLAITSGVADAVHARQALANYPVWEAGSPVIWPERADVPIYHNRAIWPFVSAYALRAARVVDDPERIAHELRSLMRGAALAGSNMENFELTTQAVHVEDGALSGPVVDSPRQLWSVAGYLDMVIEGVFGLQADGRIEPKLPTSLVPMLFGDKDRIRLKLGERDITLVRPAKLDGNLLVAGQERRDGAHTVVTLKAVQVAALPLRTNAPLYAPATPDAPNVSAEGKSWKVAVKGEAVLYLNGAQHGTIRGSTLMPKLATQQCFSVTRMGDNGIESLHSPSVCVGDTMRVAGDWPREWKAPRTGRFQAALDYANDHGPINTGITAAVQVLTVRCDGSDAKAVPLVLPHSAGQQRSTSGSFATQAGAHCRFALEPGFNMTYLGHFGHYTGGKGGIDGPLNTATIGDLLVTPLL
ncbi:alpha-L-rhamnosidase-related protein [Dyella koreensis]|uniref:Six-hairpin glycosidase-like protein n=1 Tax=Dyella koreensis TaxID=311235 RepID=A0ABW8K2R8_9GAMM